MANIEDLVRAAREIRNETRAKKNTALRVGDLLLNIIDRLSESSVVKNTQYGGIVATSGDIPSDYASKDYRGPYFYLVGSAMTSLSAYQYSGAGVPAQLFGGATYNFADYSEILVKVDELLQDIGRVAPIIHPYSEVLQDYTWWNVGGVAIGSTYTGAYGTLSGGEWRRWQRLSVLVGQKVTISTKGGQSARAFCITNAETNIVIAKGDANASYIDEPYVYTAEVDSFLYVNTSKNYEGYISIENLNQTTISERVSGLESCFSSIGEEVSVLKESVMPIIKDCSASIEEPTVINDISSYAIDVDGSVIPISLSGFHVKFYEVEPGAVIHVQITRANANSGKRLSGCFYHTDDDQTYNVVSIDGFVLWRANGNLSVDYEVTVPTGVNRVGVYGGQTNPNVLSFLVEQKTYGDFALLKEKASGIFAAAEEVSMFPPSALNERISTIEDDMSFSNIPAIFNPFPNLKKTTLKVLDIGNSFTSDAVTYLPSFITSANLEVSDMCLYTMLRSSGSWYTFIKSWLGQDGSSGTTSAYGVQKVFGGITPTFDNTNALARMHSVLKDVDWDIIVVHQVSDYSAEYEQWEGNTNSGYLKEVISILRTYQPQASLGMLMAHVSKMQSSGNTQDRWLGVAKSVKFLHAKYGVDFVIPVATAIENIRASSVNTSTHGLSRDNHHLGYGLARYVAAATYYQSLVCGRYGGSVVGNTCIHTVTTAEHNDVAESYQGDLIDVTAENSRVAQIAAALACSNMFTIVNPDNVEI